MLLAGTLAACSTASVRVLPGENGLNRVMVRDIERDDAEEEAVDAAKEYCADRKQEAVFVKDKTAYTGKMDENTRNTVRKASTAAMVLGGGGVAARQTTAGAILGGAGTAGHIMTNDRDYEVEVQFRCR